MKMPKGKKASAVGGLNIWGGVKNNEQKNTSNGFSGKQPSQYFGDLSNEQKAMGGKVFKGFPHQKGAEKVYARGCSSDNENPKGWKQ